MTTADKLASLFTRIDTNGLVDAFEATESMDGAHIPKVREWIMNELERRNDKAFAEWMDAPNAGSPRPFFA